MAEAESTVPILYHGHGTRSLRVAWLLHELGVPFREIVVSFPPRLLQPDHLTVNPTGSLPFFVDGSSAMTESVAICLHLAEVHGPTRLAVESGEPGRAEYLQL